MSRHNFLTTEVHKSPSTDLSLYRTKPLQYLRFPYPPHVVQMISCLPSGWQAISYQYHAISLELMTEQARSTGWSHQVDSNLDPKGHKISYPYPFEELLRRFWAIIERLNPQEAAFERFICISTYITAMRMTYVGIVHQSPIFCNLRADASSFISKYQRGDLCRVRVFRLL
jgi:hypothetical protein